jgi:hypothetical protein
MRFRTIAVSMCAATLACSTACLPYSLGSTAQTVAPGERRITSTLWIMPNGIGLRDDSLAQAHTLRGFDSETRWGIDDASDFGLRVPSGTGLVATYKRRVLGYAHPDSGALAWQAGLGIVNVAEHALVELSLLASGPRRGGATLYGGARVMQVAPISEGAVHDLPSIGALAGVRLSIGDVEVLPELAVYHDPSALHIRKSDIIYVPSVSVRGTSFFGALGRLARLCAPCGR